MSSLTSQTETNTESKYNVKQHYNILQTLGKGTFGCVYLAKRIQDGKSVAIKVEKIDNDGNNLVFNGQKTDPTKSQLFFEYHTYLYLNQQFNNMGVPIVYEYQSNATKHGSTNYLVMERLGPTLEKMKQIFGTLFPTYVLCWIGIELITRLQEIHRAGYIHRDLKPDNFLLARVKVNEEEWLHEANRDHDHDLNSDLTSDLKSTLNPSSDSSSSSGCHYTYKLHCIDFGIAKRYCDGMDDNNGSVQNHIPESTQPAVFGTLCYISMNAHIGMEQSRRDDLESLYFILLYLCSSTLPWQNMDSSVDRPRRDAIFSVKSKLSGMLQNVLIGDKKEWMQLFLQIKQLQFTETPNYDGLRHQWVKVCNSTCVDISRWMDLNRYYSKENQDRLNLFLELFYPVEDADTTI